MKNLYVLVGAPASGKSTFIKKNCLERYTVSSDEIRLLWGCPQRTADNHWIIPCDKTQKVFSMFYNIIEERMKNGELLFVDATNLDSDSFRKYKKLAQKYKYRKFIVDFTDIDFEELRKRNKNRENFRYVPEISMNKMFDKIINFKMPSGFKVIKPSELNLDFTPLNIDNYEKIHIFGDIHGCYTALKKYLDNHSAGIIKENEFYVFLGDYFDKGIENDKVFAFLEKIADKNNVILLEGNHEKHLRNWIYGDEDNYKDFFEKTISDFTHANITKSKVDSLYRKFAQCGYFEYNNELIVCTHGGIDNIPTLKTSSSSFSNGIGTYGDEWKVAENFITNTPKNCISVFGHRNVEKIKNTSTKPQRTYDLECGVEKGGYLSVLQIANGFKKQFYIKNDVFDKKYAYRNDKDFLSKISPKEAIEELRNNKYIIEKRYDKISSFNFSREAFSNKIWNNMTEKARGLFIDNETCRIIARGFDKFFNIEENKETSVQNLKLKFDYPVNAYVKSNGYLGLLTVYNGELTFFSKTSPESDFAKKFEKGFLEKHSDIAQKLKEYIQQKNVTLLFEVIIPKFDTHIIEYAENHFILLDEVKNSYVFAPTPYDILVNTANKFGLEVKEKATTLENSDDFVNFFREASSKNYKYKGTDIEGFVLVDTNNYYVKLKTYYYNYWKYIRNCIENLDKKGLPQRPLYYIKPFFDFYKENNDKISGLPLIEIRKKFFEKSSV